MLPVSRSRWRWRWWVACVGLAACLLWSWGAQAGGHEGAQPAKKAILLVSFGTSVPQARQVFAKIEEAAKTRFPGVEVRWAFTSKKVRQKLAQEGQVTLSPALALANLAEDGYTRVAAQSLHIIPGQEFEGLKETARRFAGMPKGLKQVEVGAPLLLSHQDMERTAKALLAHVPKERRPSEALVFMGHGTTHQANEVYPAMAGIFKELDAYAFLATVEGSPEWNKVKQEIKARGIKKAWLIPLMSVAGDHARNDMAGPEDDSWASQLGQAGIASQPVLMGMAEYPEVVAVWLDHLQTAWDRLGKE
ncbi:MAG: sirohydrochlorin cobaltochelatase [Desulfarculus sp.]|nr:sirohydrochlorin cobaltochelatase [Desulfarculus sp.]